MTIHKFLIRFVPIFGAIWIALTIWFLKTDNFTAGFPLKYYTASELCNDGAAFCEKWDWVNLSLDITIWLIVAGIITLLSLKTKQEKKSLEQS